MPLCPEGNYTAEIIDQAVGKTRNGVPQLILRVRIAANEPIERNIFLFLTESAMPYTKTHLRNLGYVGTTIRALDPGNESHHSLVGQETAVYCKHEMYDGKTQEKWALSRNQGIHGNPVTTEEAIQLDHAFQRAKEPETEHAPRNVAPYVAPLATDGTEITDDDIPF